MASPTRALVPDATPMRRALEQLKPHDHLCSIFSNDDEHFAVAIPFIQIGLERNEKCLYIADDHNVRTVRERLVAAGVDVQRATASGALVVITKDEAYMKRGRFDPDWMFTYWRAATTEALNRGFTALRATGETEWVQRGGLGLERWMEYESRLTTALHETPCFALCQYNRELCAPDVILNVIRTHPLIICGDKVCRNFYFVPPDEFLHPDPAAHEVDRLLRTIGERERLESDLRAATEELEARVIELQASNAKLEDSERRLNAHAQRLERANNELQQFAYLTSHDLQEPLRMVASFTQLLEKRYKDKLDDDGREYIAFAVDGAMRMKDLIQDVLAYSRVGTHGKEFAPVDTRVVVGRAIESLPEVHQSGASITVGQLPPVVGDDHQLVQLFKQLISNAIKFRRAEPPAIRIAAEERDGEHLFSVADNGIGIASAYLERIFVMFQRLHTREEYPGTGAGLAICRKIVERHRGRIWVESAPGQGSTFFFTLPATGA